MGLEWLNAPLFDFLVGALVGASIHLGGALWYTKRQRVRFEADVSQRLEAAQEGIVERVLENIPPPPQIPDLGAVVERSVTAQLVVLRAEIPSRVELELKLNDVRERTVAAIQGWWGSRVARFEEEARRLGTTAEELAEDEELKSVLGARGAKAVRIGERLLERRRKKRGLNPDGSTPTPREPSAPAQPAPSNGSGPQLRPDIIAAFEKAGFKREVHVDGSASSSTPGPT